MIFIKKKLKIAVIARFRICSRAERIFTLCFGQDQVRCSSFPEDLFWLMKNYSPHALILDPLVFDESDFRTEDLLACLKTQKCKLILLLPERREGQPETKFETLPAAAVYRGYAPYFQIAADLPKLCTREYRKQPNPDDLLSEEIDGIFRESGFQQNMPGRTYLNQVLVMLYRHPELMKKGGKAKIIDKLSQNENLKPKQIEGKIQSYLEQSWVGNTPDKFYQILNIPESFPLDSFSFVAFNKMFLTYFVARQQAEQKIKSK